MRVIIAIIIFITMLDNCESARGFGKTYFKNLNKAIHNACNYEAYNITNNTDIYKCMRKNTSHNCMHIDNFTTYITIKDICITRCNGELGKGVIISIICWVMLMLLCQCQK